MNRIGYKLRTSEEAIKEEGLGEEDIHEAFEVVEDGMTVRYWRCHNNGKDHHDFH